MRRNQAIMGAAALAAALSLTGCGIPDFVYGFCRSELTPALAQAAIDGLNTVTTQCSQTFHAQSQINMCISEGVSVLRDAEEKTMPQFVDQCAHYVDETVCNEFSHCHGKPDKITPSQAQPAAESYVKTNSGALTVRMKAVLDSKISDIVTRKYDEKYRNRAVPNTVQGQCSNVIQLRLGNADILTQPTLKIFDVCMHRGGTMYDIRNCQDYALRQLHDIVSRRTQDFKMQCAHAALAAACPKGSACGIETYNADTTRTSQEAVNYMWSHFQNWLTNLQASLMHSANNNHHGFYRRFDQFAHPAWQGSGLLTLVSIGAAVGGVGCVVAGVRYARKHSARSSQASLSRGDFEPTSETIELMSTEEAEA